MVPKKVKTYLFIPGGWHGGWAFDTIMKSLEKLGEKCHSLTLPGLESEPLLQNKIINLDTHIQYVADFVLRENICEVILCGHSYGGMVITGVADKIPEKITALIYIDAYIPQNGDSCWSLTSEKYRQLFVSGSGKDGFTVAVPPGSDGRRRPHPLATFMQNIQLDGNYQQVHNKTFVYMSGWEETPFKQQYQKLKNLADWHVITVDCGHNIMRENPDKLTQILISKSISSGG